MTVNLRDLLVLLSGVAAASQVSALSLGNSQGNVQLGSPMDLVFQLKPDAGHTAETSCVAADILMGDVPLARGDFTLVPQGNSVRVQTTIPVNEPLLTVKLSAGCSATMTRSYTFFADPPGSMAASVQPIDLSKIQAAAPLPAAFVAGSAGASTATRAAATPRRPAKRAVNPRAVQDNSLPAYFVPSMVASADTVDIPAPEETPAKSASQPAAVPSGTADAQAADTGRSRQRMEPLDGLEGLHAKPADASTAPATDAVADAAAVGTGAAAAAAAPLPDTVPEAESPIAEATQVLLQANTERIDALEGQLLALKKQLTSNLTEISTLQRQLVEAQNAALPVWVHAALGLLALALACIAWLLQRLRQERLKAQNDWANTVLAVENSASLTRVDTDSAAVRTGKGQLPSAPVASPVAAAKAEPVAKPVASMAAASLHTRDSVPQAQELTQFPDTAFAESSIQPPSLAPATMFPLTEVLTAQALFDVQEQAEFYASIGENDQAIEILQAHIAEHENSSPLAYVELLQLLFRLGRMDAYEEVRQQFQKHFNVHIPDFLGFSRKGRDLWSAHPDVLAQIEALWPTDEVQELLRNLILRKNEAAQRFDLAAFDELLMLYNVAKSTPAASRGAMPGRRRTAPSEAPLPEIAPEVTPGQAVPPLPEVPGAASPVQTAAAPAAEAPPVLSLDEAHLDLLSTMPVHEPLEQQSGQSHFQPVQHFAPDEALVAELSLDLSEAASQPAVPAAATVKPLRAPEAQAMDLELQAFIMDERDLPPATKNR
mgnify:FL=1